MVKILRHFGSLRYNKPMNKKIKIVLVSDNHGQREGLEYVRTAHSDADYFFHCGDTELPPYELHGFAVVQGNNDYYGTYPMRKILEIGSHRIMLVHGHRDVIFGHYEMLADKAAALGCDIACFGHSHIYHDSEVNGVRLLNPGSIWRNRDGSQPSYMIVTLDGDRILAERKTFQKNLKSR